MKSLYEKETLNDVLQRLENLAPSSQRQWGKMDVAQMLAHCSSTLTMAKGERTAPRVFIGRLIGSFLKSVYSNEKPFGKDSPTSKESVIVDKRDFEKEKTGLIAHIRQFSEGGAAKCTPHPHPFFGKLTSEEWGIGMYKHLDHHFRQFGA